MCQKFINRYNISIIKALQPNTQWTYIIIQPTRAVHVRRISYSSRHSSFNSPFVSRY